MNSTQEDEYDPCEYQPQIFLEWKMIFVGVLGLLTALISIAHNSILFYTFCTSRLLRQRNLTYLQWMAGCDIFVSLSYIFIMCGQVYMDFFESLTLHVIWHQTIRVAFTISHVTLSCASFLLMAVTIERYLQSAAENRAVRLFRRVASRRKTIILLCFVACLILKGTVFFEVEVVYHTECSPESLSSMGLNPVRLFPSPLMDAIWKFWIRKIITVFLPFVVLAYFNLMIVMNVRKTDKDQIVKTLVLSITVGNRGETTRLRSRVRAMTRMLIMVVTCYLAANVVDLVVAFWETIDVETLYANAGFYAVVTDISSFLPILACALKLPIYATNDKQIKRQVKRNIRSCLQRMSNVFPFLPSSVRLKRKLYDPIDDERMCPMRNTTQPYVEVKTTGIGSLIMARASLAKNQRDYLELKRYGHNELPENNEDVSASSVSI